MAITATLDDTGTVVVVLSPGDVLCAHVGPKTLFVAPEEGNVEYDALCAQDIPITSPRPAVGVIVGKLCAEIDAEAEVERMRHETPGVGQARVYEAKATEAVRFAADPAPKPNDYPLLTASVGIDAPTLAGVATLIADRHHAWSTRMAAIETIRRGAKEAIRAAKTVDAARAARARVAWPTS